MKIAVIGIGQSLRGDDAVGLNAVRQWQEKYPETVSLPDLQVELMEIPGLGLLDLINRSEAVILVDAVKSSFASGTLHHLSLEQLSSFTSDSKSAHGWGVSETLQLNLLLNPSSRGIYILLIGIEAEQFQMGNGLSENVRQAIPIACKAIQDEVQALLANKIA